MDSDQRGDWRQLSQRLLTFVSNFLVPQQNPMGRSMPRYDLRNMVFYVEQLNVSLAKQLERFPNVMLLDTDQIVTTMGRKYAQDDAAWAICHGTSLGDWDHPFDQERIQPPAPMSAHYKLKSNEFWAAVWAEVLALYRVARQIDQVKLVGGDAAVDCLRLLSVPLTILGLPNVTELREEETNDTTTSVAREGMVSRGD